MEPTANEGRAGGCKAWRRQIQRERESLGCHGCQMALTREAKRDNEGPISRTNPPAPSHIALEGSALWAVTVSALGCTWGHIQHRWCRFLVCLRLGLMWKCLGSSYKDSEVKNVFPNLQAWKWKEGVISVLTLKPLVLFLQELSLWFSVIACLFVLILSQALVECSLVDRYGDLDHQ